MLVLRKSIGRFSAGTPVRVIEQPGKTRTTVTVEAVYTEVTYFRSWDGKREEKREIKTDRLWVDSDMLVERRSASDLVPAVTQQQRRSEKKSVDNVILGMLKRG